MSRPREFWVSIGLLWLAGIGLRLTVLAVPPVLLLIQADLQLTGTGVGVLSGLPIIVFGLGALPASLLVARIGAVRTLVLGLLVGGIASGLRGALLSVVVLYGATIVMSAGLAFMQTALPALVRQWLPHRVSLATATFSNGLLVGETLAVMLTIPLVLPLAGGSWRGALALWGVPLLLFAMLTLVLAPGHSQAESTASPSRAWPNWRSKQVWQFGILFGSVNAIYFGTNAFVPPYLSDAGRPDLIGPVLTALNFGQLPASFALLAISRLLERRAWPFVCRLFRIRAGHASDALFRSARLAERFRRGSQYVRRHVPDQLQRGTGDFRAQRRRLGLRRKPAICLSAHCAERLAVVVHPHARRLWKRRRSPAYFVCRYPEMSHALNGLLTKRDPVSP